MSTNAPIRLHRISDDTLASMTPDAERDRAVHALFVAHYDSLRRLAFLLLGDAGNAEEVVMDAFAKALSRWRIFKSIEDPAVYMRRMVVNGCHSRHRRRKLEDKTLRLFQRRPERDAQWDADVSASSLALWSAVKELPMPQRTCLVLRYLDDLPEAHIAAVMDLPVGTVKARLSRARQRLAESLGPEFFGGETP